MLIKTLVIEAGPLVPDARNNAIIKRRNLELAQPGTSAGFPWIQVRISE